MRIKMLALVFCGISLFARSLYAEGPNALTPLFKDNSNKCIPDGIKDLPAFTGNSAVSGSCKVSAVVTGNVKKVSDYYFAHYQKLGWDVANRVQTDQEHRFTAQKKKKLFSISFVQVSQENTSIEFSY